MLITLIRIRNFQGIKEIEIIPRPGDRNWILIAGKNEQGKSSLMNAIRSALGGGSYKPEMPVREGEDSASIYMELDNGETVLTKTFSEDGKSKLKLVNAEYGKLSSPQVALDKIVGDRFLDPMEFMRLNGKAQREKLLSIVPIDIDLDDNAKKRKGIFSARTDVNRDVKRLRAELGAFDLVDEIPERMDMQALIAEHQELLVQVGRAADAKRKVEDAERNRTLAKERVTELLRKLGEANDLLKLADNAEKDTVAAMKDTAKMDVTEDLEAIREEMSKCDAHNESVGKLEATRDAVDSVSSKLAEAEGQAKDFDAKIKALDKAKADALAAAEMPVEGLDIGEDSVLFGGVPLSQASSARKIRISLALASAAKPQLADIQIENGSLLDEDSIKEVMDYASENGLRVWLEMVGEAHDDCIIIEEGEIKDRG